MPTRHLVLETRTAQRAQSQGARACGWAAPVRPASVVLGVPGVLREEPLPWGLRGGGGGQGV